MSRLRMEWTWVGDYPIFVYMRFIDHGKWSVKVVKGVKGNQNAGDTSPRAKAWFEYTAEGCISRMSVLKDAERKAKCKIQK